MCKVQISKMDFYLEALDRQKRKENENPSVGMILCASKDDEVVEYAIEQNDVANDGCGVSATIT